MAQAFVNTDTGTGDGGATSVATAGASHTTGNHLSAMVVWSSATVTLDTVTDTAGNTFTRAPSSKATSASVDNAETFYAFNITGNAANVVTANLSASATFRRIIVQQYSGTATTSPLDGVGIGTASAATSVTSSAFTANQADEVITSIASSDNVETWAAGAAGTVRVTSLGTDTGSEDQIISATGSYTGNMTCGLAAGLRISTTAYKAAVTASGALHTFNPIPFI